jgi:toxin ParE1/3/4
VSRPVQRRAAAAADVEQAVGYYVEHGDVDLAVRFIDAVEAAMAQLARRPHAGSLRFSHELGIPDLRAYRVRRFPHVVFYVIRADVIDVWRVLHERRDLPNSLAAPES